MLHFMKNPSLLSIYNYYREKQISEKQDHSSVQATFLGAYDLALVSLDDLFFSYSAKLDAIRSRQITVIGRESLSSSLCFDFSK